MTAITPIVLGYMMVQNIITNIKENYEGYPTSFLLYSGWGVAIGAIILGFVFMAIKKNDTQTKLTIPADKEVSQ